MSDIKWVGSHIEVTPPKRPKKITGTRLAAILGYNKWATPFEAWCAITRTYEKPFEDTIYTAAGKIIEPKIDEYLRKRYFMDIETPEDVYGEDFFKQTYGDFFPHVKVFGGMWDARGEDFIVEIKTTKRAEDWEGEPPLYYMIQGALYAYLSGMDEVLMVCSFLEESDYKHPDDFVPTISNTIQYRFRISERFPTFEQDVITEAVLWWDKYVRTGISPDFDEKADAEILKALRTNTVAADAETDGRPIGELVAEYEMVLDDIAWQRKHYDIDELEKRADALKGSIKDALQKSFRAGDKKAEYASESITYTVTKKAGRETVDTKALKAELPAIYQKYTKIGAESYALTTAAIKSE